MENKPAIFRNAFNLFAGRGRQFSVSGVAEGSGIDRRAIQAHKDGECDVPTEKLVSYMAVLPPAFCNEILAHAGLGGASRLEDADGCTHRLLGKLGLTVGRMTEMLADDRSPHRFDHLEEAELKQVLPALREAIDRWLAAHSSAAEIVLAHARKRGGAAK